jgi:uncharacterized protein YndB with AHSA1/START domain
MPMPKREPRDPPTVDVVSEIEIRRPRDEVAAFVCDQDNAPAWNDSVDSVEWESAQALAEGSRFTHVSGVLGGRVDYDYQVLELVPGERLVVSTEDGPFALRTTYTWADGPNGATTMTLHSYGHPDSLGRLSVPIIAKALRRANDKNLKRLKRLLEG